MTATLDSLDELEALHNRDFEDDMDEVGPAKACWSLTCAVFSDG